jgi:hypothetical protein
LAKIYVTKFQIQILNLIKNKIKKDVF